MSENAAQRIESRALRLSVFGYLLMAALGIGFAWLTRSEAIMLDGIYSLVSFVMALLARRVAALVDSPGSEIFHFGYAHFEPLLNLVRGLLILVICAFALVSAIDALLHGGRPLNAGIAVIYGVGAAATCLLFARAQKRAAEKVQSPILTVDARSWFVDGMVSLGAGLAFIIAFAMGHTHWNEWVPYVDPALVTVMCLVLVRVPLMTVWENLREVLMVAPEPEMQARIRGRIEGVVQELNPRGLHVRMWNVGRVFYCMVHLVLPEDYPCHRVGDLDDVRNRIRESLRDFHPRLAVDAIVTADPDYAAGAYG